MEDEYRFKNGTISADVAGWCQSQSSHESSAQVRSNISVQIGKHQYLQMARQSAMGTSWTKLDWNFQLQEWNDSDLKLLWACNKLQADLINRYLFIFNVGVAAGDFSASFQEHAIW